MAMKTSSLKKIPAAKAKRAAVRCGRPPKELAGEVDARILDAARKVFLERGFEGASIDEIVKALDWQPHTVRGAIAGALKKKLGLNVTSEKVEGRGRVYRIPG